MGYFHQIHKADIFVFYDCVQYDTGGWRNRNKIKTSEGSQWLTIPVKTKGCHTSDSQIKDIRIRWENHWNRKHKVAIDQNYQKAPFYSSLVDLLEEIYSRKDIFLSDFTCKVTELLARKLGIQHTQFARSSEFFATGSKTDRILEILKCVGATHYISGPSAVDYLEQDKLADSGISLEFMTYEYLPYPQLYSTFQQKLSVLDLMFNVGTDAGKYIWSNK